LPTAYAFYICVLKIIYFDYAIGRLFSDTPKGAKASAALYGLIETAKANGLEPYAY